MNFFWKVQGGKRGGKVLFVGGIIFLAIYLLFTPSGFSKPASQLNGISIREEGGLIEVLLKADGEIAEYKELKFSDPPRLALDLIGIRSAVKDQIIPFDGPFLKRVRLGVHPDKVRVVLDLSGGFPPYVIEKTEGGLSIYLGRKEVARGEKPLWVKEFGFKQLPLTSRIFIKTGKWVKYHTEKKDNEMIFKAEGVFFPKRFLRPLDTREFNSPVDWVIPINVRKGPFKGIKVVVKLEEKVPYQVVQKDGTIYLDFERTGKFAAREKPKPVKIVVKKPAEVKKRVAKAPASASPIERLLAGEKVYTGKRVTLDFKDADIDNVLRLFADISGINILVTEDVKGKVTIRLKDVPWDQALDIILATHNLGMERVGNVIRISTLERLRKEREARLKVEKAKEKLEPLTTELIPVSYGKASDLAPKVKDILSPRGSVTIDERTNTLIVKDVKENVEKAKDLVRRLDTQTPQVLIEAKIVEARTDFVRELGITWGGRYYSERPGGYNEVSGGIAPTTGTGGNWVVNLPASVGTGSGGAIDFLIGNLMNTRYFEIQLSAMENNGLGRIISSPRITTLDHKEAYIEQGVRIPYLKLTAEGTVSTEFLDATLKLTVTPHVTADGHIRMEIECSRESPDWSRMVQGEPTINKSKAKTEVMSKNGEVVVIGGIYEFTGSERTSGVPGLKDVPLLGWLFKTKHNEKEKRELLIFIMPRIVQPRQVTAG